LQKQPEESAAKEEAKPVEPSAGDAPVEVTAEAAPAEVTTPTTETPATPASPNSTATTPDTKETKKKDKVRWRDPSAPLCRAGPRVGVVASRWAAIDNRREPDREGEEEDCSSSSFISENGESSTRAFFTDAATC
jgi:hypothetical protein